MKKPLVVLTHPFLRPIIDQELRPFAEVKIARSRAELFNLLENASGLITRFSDPVDRELLSHAPKLKAIGNFAVGINNIDLAACKAAGVRVTNTPDVLTRATAELTLTLLLAASRRFFEGERLCREGRFKGWAPDMLLGLELEGRTAVIVGKGRIGSEAGKLFRAIGLKTVFITRRDSESQIRSKLKRAQILSLHCPLTKETYHWLNSKRLSLLPPDAVVINTTRGPVVDERALIRHLKAGRIFAAGLDVYEHEPQIPPALRKLPNVVLMPHLGSATQRARIGMARLAIQGVLGVLSGKRPPNEVTLS